MATEAQPKHKPGPLKQKNKQHKHGRHRTKGQIENTNKGVTMDTSSLLWGDKNMIDIGSVNPVNCMIDETATKIIIEFNPYDMKLYGLSAMPQYVIVRNITNENFDIENLFHGIPVQHDKKTRKHLIGTHDISVNEEQYVLGYAQFETYEGWRTALNKNGQHGVTVESIPSFPLISPDNSKCDIDQVFAEAEALNRPRSTYVYSLAVGQTTVDAPLYEVAAISTNNRYLQNQDHKLLTYNLIKMLNRNHVPVFQFVADGDSRIRNQMLQMSAYEYKDTTVYTHVKLDVLLSRLKEICNSSGWVMPVMQVEELFHYIVPSNELKRASYAKHLLSEPQIPFRQRNRCGVLFGNAMLGRCFPSYAPFLGGLPRTCTQDQCHWLRKLVKSSTLSTKPLRLGNFVVAFSHLCCVYEMGPDFGLIRRDVDINNKTDQKSAERLINVACESGLQCIDWAEGTAFLIKLGKTAFESWWKADLSVIDRMVKSYYALKVFHLWKLWIERSNLNMEQHFITLELYRDTVIMCSSLIHLAIVFKLYLPNKPFLPWKWSEYPLESYYSSIRYLFGNDDEFSILEYRHRAERNISQQKLVGNHTLLNTRKKILQEICHIQLTLTPTTIHNCILTIGILLIFCKKAVDKQIQLEFSKLGMSNLLQNEELYQVMSPQMRLEKLKGQFPQDCVPDFFNIDVVQVEMEVPVITGNLEHGTTVRSIRPPTVPVLNIDGKRTTVSKYVTIHKQRGDKKQSGQRNVMRFRLEDDQHVDYQDEVMLHQGDYFLTQQRYVFEIIQLRRRKTFLFEVESNANVEVIGVVYRKVSDDIFYAEPKFIRKNYVALRRTFYKKLDVIKTWYNDIKKFIQIRRDEDMENIDGEDEELDDDQNGIYCFCLSDDADEQEFILCGNATCRIKWYHLTCVGLTSNTVPLGAWECARCREEDHWCTCGNKGKVDVKALSRKSKTLDKRQKRHQAKQIRKNKRDETMEKKRRVGTEHTPPRVIAVFPLSQLCNCEEAVSNIIESDDSILSITKEHSQTIISTRHRQRFTILTPNPRDLFEILDAGKASDSSLFVVPADGNIGEYNQKWMTYLIAQGLPSTIFAIQGLKHVPIKKQSDTKKNITKQLEKWFPEVKLHPIDSQKDAGLVLRLLANQKQKPIFYREKRPYMLVDHVQMDSDNAENEKGTLKISGYIRGKQLSVNRLIHLPGLGDFQMKQIDLPSDPYTIRKKQDKNSMEEEDDSLMEEDLKVIATSDPSKQMSLVTEAEVDPMEGEQTWPTEEELLQADEEAQKVNERKQKKVPKGTSEYQAAWIVDENDDDEEEEDDEDSDSEDMHEVADAEDEEESEHGDEYDTISIAASTVINDAKYDEDFDMDEEQKQLEKYRLERENEMFPDEVDTPMHMPASERFQRYRGLKSFRTSPWDPKENLPLDYARIFQFQNFNRTKKKILKEDDEESDSALPGWYVTIHVCGVPKTYVETWNPKHAMLVFGLLPHEQKMTVMNFAIKRHPTCNLPIKAKDRLIFHVGYRRFISCPIFSQHTTGDKFKAERFLPHSDVVIATVYAPIMFPPAPVLVFTEEHQLVATGSVLGSNPDRIIVKKIVLSGHPFKINKKSSVVRYMFFNREDILWFKPVELSTKYGRRGHIKEPLGTHGHMKCVFDGQLKAQDTICMNLFKRIYPKWIYEPSVAAPVRVPFEAISEDIEDTDM